MWSDTKDAHVILHSSRQNYKSVMRFVFIFSIFLTSSAFGQFDALIFSKTAGFRHPSITEGSTMIQQLGAANNFTTTFTEDSNAFTAGNLAQYEVVIFLSTTGGGLNTT